MRVISKPSLYRATCPLARLCLSLGAPWLGWVSAELMLKMSQLGAVFSRNLGLRCSAASGFHCSFSFPHLVRNILCLGFPHEHLRSCCWRLVRLYTERMPQFSPLLPLCPQPQLRAAGWVWGAAGLQPVLAAGGSGGAILGSGCSWGRNMCLVTSARKTNRVGLMNEWDCWSCSLLDQVLSVPAAAGREGVVGRGRRCVLLQKSLRPG